MKKFLSMILVGVMSASLLAGCGTKNAETKTTAEPSKEKTVEKKVDKPAKEEVVEINFWNFPNYTVVDDTPGKYEDMLVEAFEAKNPGIKVNVQMIDFKSGPEKINTSIVAGTAPDVVYDAPGRIVSWGNDGVLASLNDMITSDVTSNISDSILTASKSGDNYWMYPTHQAPFMMAFNKDLLEELDLLKMLNLEGNRAWTTEEFEAFLKALTAKEQRGPIVFAQSQGGDQGTRAFIANLYGSSVVNDDITGYALNDEAGVKGLQWTVDAINNGLLENGCACDAGTAIDEFVAGRVAGTLLWSPGLEKIKKANMNFETVFVPYPNSANELELEFLVGGLCVFDNGDNAKIEASKKFVDFLANDPEWAPKNIKSTGSFPANKTMTGVYDNPVMEYNASMSEYYGAYYNTIPGFAEMRTSWFPTLQAAINGDNTVKEALDNFVEAANATVK